MEGYFEIPHRMKSVSRLRAGGVIRVCDIPEAGFRTLPSLVSSGKYGGMVARMPRINIEDVWWDDPRRDELANLSKSKQMADGIAIGFWRLAQTWHRAGSLIPYDIFERVPYWSEFVQCGLAIKRPEGYYVCGKDEKFQWLTDRRKSGQKGGNAEPKQTKAKRIKRKQVEASSSSSSSSSFSTSPYLPSDRNLSASGGDAIASEPPVRTLGSEIWESYAAAYRTIYGTDPVRNKTTNSQCKALGERLGRDAPLVAEFFLSHRDMFYSRSMHPLGLLLRDAEKLRTEWKTGRMMTGAIAKQASVMSNNQQALEIALEMMNREDGAK